MRTKKTKRMTTNHPFSRRFGLGGAVIVMAAGLVWGFVEL